MRCVTCEGDLKPTDFSEGSPICKECVATLTKLYEVEYSAPQKHTKLIGFLELIIAMKNRALADGHLEEFEEWLNMSSLAPIMDVLREHMERGDGEHEATKDILSKAQ